MKVEKGKIACLIGGNGAGKSTLLRTVSGLMFPDEGEIVFEGRRIDSLPAHRVTAMGLAQVPEGRRIFPRLTVRENLEMGAYSRADKKGIEADLGRVFTLFPVLRNRQGQAGGTLSGGEQQMLAIGRALMARPKLLMLDEPSMGLAPIVVEKIFEILLQINSEGMTMLLVEQNAQQALQIAHHGYVMETGRIALEDDARALLRNEDVRKSYLGIE
ncbi:MAG: ABC transporter ATP-binding protein [Elusimicrobia bacterium]|nr:ABC transporter ATP-binding protein [Elusimicrobiota bacterium]